MYLVVNHAGVGSAFWDVSGGLAWELPRCLGPVAGWGATSFAVACEEGILIVDAHTGRVIRTVAAPLNRPTSMEILSDHAVLTCDDEEEPLLVALGNTPPPVVASWASVCPVPLACVGSRLLALSSPNFSWASVDFNIVLACPARADLLLAFLQTGQQVASEMLPDRPATACVHSGMVVVLLDTRPWTLLKYRLISE